MKVALKIAFAILFLPALLMLCIGVFNSCVFARFDTYDSGYFVCQVSRKDGQLCIIGLTDSGKEQEYLVIPEMIDGKKVDFVSAITYDVYRTKNKYTTDEINFESENLKKIFIVSGVGIVNKWLGSKLFSDKESFYISNADVKFTNDFFRTSLKSNDDPLTTANVSYDYNYENSPNDGYYWIDNYAYGEKIEYIPEQPIRDGYTFDGWYKESDCKNVWDFETDTLPQERYDDYDKEIYQETRLYAKWIKK